MSLEESMTLEEYAVNYSEMSIPNKAKFFNCLCMQDRRAFLKSLSAEKREEFIDEVRRQAVQDFWTHERDLIEQGACTRDWTPEQIETIMNISTATGKKRKYADAAATNAALAWLGGGALAASGGGMAAGEALLALAEPVGWGIAGATLLTSVVLFTNKKIKLDKEKKLEIDKAANTLRSNRIKHKPALHCISAQGGFSTYIQHTYPHDFRLSLNSAPKCTQFAPKTAIFEQSIKSAHPVCIVKLFNRYTCIEYDRQTDIPRLKRIQC